MAGSRLEPFHDEWFDELAVALGRIAGAGEAAELPGDGAPAPPVADATGRGISVGQEILAVPGLGDVRYLIRVRAGASPELVRGTTDGADVTLVEEYDAASALLDGSVAMHELLTAGRIKVRGDARALVAAGTLLGELAGALTPGR